MSNNPKVNILLSTYNGEKYLAQQLDSLLSQTYSNFTICIRDDGSVDNTLSIISQYQQDFNEKIIVIDNPSGINLGYMESFWTLLRENDTAEYYSFCDQDDVWFSNKIELAVNAMEKENTHSIPLLYCSSFDYYDENLVFTGHAPVYPHPVSLKDVLFYTPAVGFTIMINQSLKTLAFNSSSLKNLPHDSWCQKLATSFGKFIYNPTVTAKYRRHSSTVTYASSSKLQLIGKWIKNDILGKGLAENYYIISRFYEEYQENLSNSDKQLLERFSSTSSNALHFFRKLFYSKRLRPSLGGELALRLCFLFNK